MSEQKNSYWTPEEREYHWMNVIANTPKNRICIMSIGTGWEWEHTLKTLVRNKMVKIVVNKGLTLHTLTDQGFAIWQTERTKRENDLYLEE